MASDFVSAKRERADANSWGFICGLTGDDTAAFVFMTIVLASFVFMPAYSMLINGRAHFQGEFSFFS